MEFAMMASNTFNSEVVQPLPAAAMERGCNAVPSLAQICADVVEGKSGDSYAAALASSAEVRTENIKKEMEPVCVKEEPSQDYDEACASDYLELVMTSSIPSPGAHHDSLPPSHHDSLLPSHHDPLPPSHHDPLPPSHHDSFPLSPSCWPGKMEEPCEALDYLDAGQSSLLSDIVTELHPLSVCVAFMHNAKRASSTQSPGFGPAKSSTPNQPDDKKAKHAALMRKIRSDPLRKAVEQAQNTASRREKRSDPVRRAAEQERNTALRRAARSDPVRRAAEQAQDTAAKRAARSDPVRRAAEQARNTASKRAARSDPVRRAAEQARNTALRRAARSDHVRKAAEQAQNTASCRAARNDPFRTTGTYYSHNADAPEQPFFDHFAVAPVNLKFHENT
ncbi:translation initiation factor IF-2-like isoform X2 [Hyalella azteca]|nr:translation initiation factor IF-2-like isoform X2 [Hyalella azteca]XP_018008538.1 translation initiation factor IF-2-like isoform X2 [Hyalella azteca]XP_018008539.1 translation initiation factor IF-2-like isoform X2 [Hyalella azteca]XP_018008540.1 translation initiation factor IF-2-like isoform X2 [Hyalella azteca]XP_018008541.1 translation initiation factor IF-2-like isoform X2 [Hyalella azteca]